MVGALICGDVYFYNQFVIAYQPDLQNHDRVLQAFFVRLNGSQGLSEYDAHKTKLANVYSLTSAENRRAFCGLTHAAFRAALSEPRTTLVEFAMTQPFSYPSKYDECGEEIAGRSWTTVNPARITAAAASVVPVPAALPPAVATRPRAYNSQRVVSPSSNRNELAICPPRSDNRNSSARERKTPADATATQLDCNPRSSQGGSSEIRNRYGNRNYLFLDPGSRAAASRYRYRRR